MKPTEAQLLDLVRGDVPLEWLAEGIRVVTRAERSVSLKAQRWDWAVLLLMRSLHVPRSQAELLVALGLRWVKAHGMPAYDQG